MKYCSKWIILKIHLQRRTEVKNWEGSVAFLSHFQNREDILFSWNFRYKILIQNEVRSFFHFSPNTHFRLEYNSCTFECIDEAVVSIDCFFGWRERELTIDYYICVCLIYLENKNFQYSSCSVDCFFTSLYLNWHQQRKCHLSWIMKN
jgi:hypothetical protein